MYPSYLNLSLKEIEKRSKEAQNLLKKCKVCPRNCKVDRTGGKLGFCQVSDELKISSYGLHFGEERPLVGTQGSGTIFMTSCNLACVYCQNYDISQLRHGYKISAEKFVEIMLSLQRKGCHNINFVTPAPYIPQILATLPLAIKQGFKIPLVYNSGGYESAEALKLLDGIIDIYMPDFKYGSNKIAEKYSSAPSYFSITQKAIKEMHRQVGDLKLKVKNEPASTQQDDKLKIDDKGIEGLAYQGLLVRHLVLPNNLADTEKVVKFIAKEISQNTFINIMDQYRPCYKAYTYPALSRAITNQEFENALKTARKAGLKRIYT